MVPLPTESLAVFVAFTLVVAGAAGIAGAERVSTTDSNPGATISPQPGNPAGAVLMPDHESSESACAATPPADLADPASDVIGWENGTWYNESIEVDQSDGLDRSEQDALVARTMARVESVRCIEFDRPVSVSVINRSEFRNRDTARGMSPNLRTFDNAKFEALFLIGEDMDSIAVQQQNRGSSVLGFYSSRSEEIVLIAEDRQALQVDELTLAHELVHAWQDQRFDLSSKALSPGVRDAVNARNGLVEGDANYVQHLYRQRCQDGTWNGTCLQPQASQGGGDLANIGVYLLKFQPYSDGPTFVRTVRTVGGWDAVDELYDRPPASTEQVIHVERYGNDAPNPPTIEDQTSENWSRVDPPNRPNYASVGEAALMSMFVFPYYDSRGEEQILSPDEWLNYDQNGEVDSFDPLDYESNYSSGWDGDRLHVYRNETNDLGYVWRIEWDSPQDATQFVAGYREVLRYWGAEQVGGNTYRIAEGGFADAFHVSVDGTTVTIVNAPTVEQLDEVRTSVDVSTPVASRQAPGPLAPGHRGSFRLAR